MAIADDVRNLFREFDGIAERYVEFDNTRSTVLSALRPQPHAVSADPTPIGAVAGAGFTESHRVIAAPTAARDDGEGEERPLESIFARLVGRAAS